MPHPWCQTRHSGSSIHVLNSFFTPTAVLIARYYALGYDKHHYTDTSTIYVCAVMQEVVLGLRAIQQLNSGEQEVKAQNLKKRTQRFICL